ncbi:hypothetical protein [Streptomyces griseorubiginosus]|uniref:hypothetical protein n=1 Tax=Streptomyces griseorubiginosus TaxID=67304 RepID=UPI000E70A7ED|nr:hypothetical protein [Streptomyces griseorubiginosus]
MSDALDRVVDALAGVNEGDVAAALTALGVDGGRQGLVRETPRTPLPPPQGSTAVDSEVEWV